MNVTLEPITRKNVEAVMNLELPPHQAQFVATNAFSIAQASYFPSLRPMAIHHDGNLAGFLLYSINTNDEPGCYGIFRLMVDPKFQGRGVGRRAMELLLRELRAQPDLRRITICYMPSNEVGKRFYASLGFVETGLDDDGEMIAEIRPAARGSR
ncbi:GNAT family N-acetyltransferase [Pseudoduganella umbonata]|uniref:Diamine N-acetyltransferase n=1 Tax=Pseudoduganella umbonata TaxID=864828 RepID=A0A4P8HU79_9BURK|nr:GNAT family N-acetyltransferase [Pseudoduganella umbonata]MBB3220520.1 diamine N-acetyltransferase [Pseudoduganella umbonata]QCP11965.1 GNAT family N-acetyltransferase [Pseudoduganella umbonata]